MTVVPAHIIVSCPPQGPHLFAASAGASCLCGQVKVLPPTTAGARIDDMSWPTR